MSRARGTRRLAGGVAAGLTTTMMMAACTPGSGGDQPDPADDATTGDGGATPAEVVTDISDAEEQTLVVCMGEFGRAPVVALEPKFAGSTPGRKHWAGVYSAVAAGAGVARGVIVGGSDRTGGAPQGEAVVPWDVAATMFAALGVDPAGHYTDPEGRPHALTTGRAIGALYR